MSKYRRENSIASDRAARLKKIVLRSTYQVAAVISGAGAYSIYYNRGTVPIVPRFIFGLAVFGIFAALSGFLESRYHRISRRLDARRASNILGHVDADEEPEDDFVLYLRAFDLAGAVRIRNPEYSETIMTPGHSKPQFVDLELGLALTLADWGTLIGLGPPEQSDAAQERGAGLVTVRNDQWKEKLAQLAKAAGLIIVIPHDSDSCLWELEVVGSSHLGKTVFVVPAEMQESEMTTGGQALVDADRWSSITAALDRIDPPLHCPKLDRKGMVWALERDGSIRAEGRFFSFSGIVRSRRQLFRVMEGLQVSTPGVLLRLRMRIAARWA